MILRSILALLATATPLLAWQASDTTHLPIVHLKTQGRGIGDTGIVVRFGIAAKSIPLRFDDPWNAYDGWADVNIHGTSSSWFDKKSMAVELTDSTGKEVKAGLLGMSRESDWILVCNYSDKSLVRNAFGYSLSARTGRYAPRNRLVEVVLDDDYQGVYLLTERIKRDSLRVDVSKLDADDNLGDSLSGGYILRVDRMDPEASWLSEKDDRVRWECVYPKASKITTAQKTYIRDFVKRFERTMDSPGFAHPDTGYRKWIAPGSFRDFLLLTEWMRNVDGYRLSSFFHKERDAKGGRLHAGPIWDLDLSGGLANYYNGWKTQGWVYEWDARAADDGSAIPFWWKTLAKDSLFSNQLACRWQELRGSVWSDASWQALLDSLARQVAGGQARNFQRWDVLSDKIWPVAYVPGTWSGEIDTLRNWLKARAQWMDDQFSKSSCSAGSTPSSLAAHSLADFTLTGHVLRWNGLPRQAALHDLRGSRIPIDPTAPSIDLSPIASGVWIVSWSDPDGTPRNRRILLQR
ncbi:MAG TPA: CotH kinase family protein [Fibrobacteria bacterium]|nr:CotH kinase family protein [Fibrobacteria bacterium]